MSRLDRFFSFITPKDLTKGVKVSTFIHAGIILFVIASPLIFRHKYRAFRPTAYTVQLVNLPGTVSGPSVQKPKPVTQPKQKSVPKPAKKPAMTIPETTPKKIQEKKEKTETLREKLTELLKKEKTQTWHEPDKITRPLDTVSPESSVSGTLGSSGTLGLSCPTNFPFQYYLENIHGKISSCWNDPQMVLDKKYSAVISFTILKSGETVNINIKQSSGIDNFDQSGIKAIESAKPFPPLPPGYNHPQLTVNVEFTLD